MQVSEFISSLESVGGSLNVIGESTLGEPIHLIRKGEYTKGGVLLVGGVHAREYITSYLLRDLIKEYDGEYPVDVVPLLNPDGVRLCLGGLDALTLKIRDRIALLRLNGGSTDFSLWKANARGVDLNVNCDANWGQGQGNVRYPAPQNYVGPCPFSEVETYALKRVIDEGDYSLVVAYHSKGEEVYYGFMRNKKYKAEATLVANALGYELKTTPRSAGGVKDYFTLSKNRLGLTVEVGADSLTHPIGLEHLDELKEKHKGIINLYTEIGKRLWTKYGLCDKQ